MVVQGRAKNARPPLATLTQGRQQQRSAPKPHALHDCDEDLLGDEAFERWAADEPQCALVADEPEHAIDAGCYKSDQPAAWETGPTSRPPCDRPRCRSRRQALRHAQRRLERVHLALIMQAWRREAQLQRSQQVAALHSAQLDGALGERDEIEGAHREMEARLEAASQQLAEQRTATAAAEQALQLTQLKERGQIEGARRAAARSLAAAGLLQSRRVATLEVQLEELSRQLAEQHEATAAAEQARQASEGEAARRHEAEQAATTAEAREARCALEARSRELEERNHELARLQAVQREAYQEINRLRAAAGGASEEGRRAMVAAVAAKEEAVTELARLQAERDVWLQSVVAAHRLGFDEGLEKASRQPRLPGDEQRREGGSCRHHQRVLEAVLSERHLRRRAATAVCATRDVAEANVELEAPREGLELGLGFGLLACAFLSAL